MDTTAGRFSVYWLIEGHDDFEWLGNPVNIKEANEQPKPHFALSLVHKLLAFYHSNSKTFLSQKKKLLNLLLL